jgi:ABC-type cobalt transport system substrate-binding protein
MIDNHKDMITEMDRIYEPWERVHYNGDEPTLENLIFRNKRLIDTPLEDLKAYAIGYYERMANLDHA